MARVLSQDKIAGSVLQVWIFQNYPNLQDTTQPSAQHTWWFQREGGELLGPIVYLGELIELAQNQWYRVWRISQIKCLCQKSLSCTAKEVILSCPPISNKNERCPQHQKTSIIYFVMPRSVFLFTVEDYSNSEASNPVSQKVSCPDCEGKLFNLRATWRKYNV